MNKKRIILIRNAKSYDFGGGERFPVLLAEILKNEDFNPIIISRSPKLLAFAKDHSVDTLKGWWWSYQNWSGVRVLLFPVYIVWQFILFIWYLQLFIRIKPSAVHAQSKDDFIAATFAGRVCGSRVIWTDHADLKHVWKNIRVWYKNPVGKLVYIAARKVDKITAVSQSERSLVTANLPNKSPIMHKIDVVYNGFRDLATQYPPSLDKDNFTFCVASRLVGDKGIGEVISAFDKLSGLHKNVHLNILGDGPHADIFKQKAAHNDKITFLGHQKHPLEYIAAADVFVHPTYHEGFSVALVEASMLSRPIIATAVGGNVEIIHDNQTGLLVKPQDESSLFNAMKRLLDDEKLRKELGENARKQYEEQFNFDRIVRESFIPLYKGESL